MKYGFVKSELDGTEKVISKVPENIDLPTEYSYFKQMSKVIDQGQNPTCVPCSVSTYINWNINMADGSIKDHDVEIKKFFKEAGGTENGMTFKDALHYLRHNGVKTDKGNYKIDQYAMIGSIPVLKYAIFMNGPCIGGLPVRDSYAYDFWNGESFEGGHAIAIIGYTEEGFIIRNSWGTSYGDSGYSILPYEDFENFYEIWTIL